MAQRDLYHRSWLAGQKVDKRKEVHQIGPEVFLFSSFLLIRAVISAPTWVFIRALVSGNSPIQPSSQRVLINLSIFLKQKTLLRDRTSSLSLCFSVGSYLLLSNPRAHLLTVIFYLRCPHSPSSFSQLSISLMQACEKSWLRTPLLAPPLIHIGPAELTLDVLVYQSHRAELCSGRAEIWASFPTVARISNIIQPNFHFCLQNAFE